MHINPMKAAAARGEPQIGTWVNLENRAHAREIANAAH